MKRYVVAALCAVLIPLGASFAGADKAAPAAKHAGAKSAEVDKSAAKSACPYSTQECLDLMASRMKDSGWVGVELEREEEGYGPMAVTKVVPGSPAEVAGIQPGDVLVAMGGIPLVEGNQEKVHAARVEWKPGSSVVWSMHRGQDKRDVNIDLGVMPADLLARYIGQHMLEHASSMDVASK